MSRRRATAVALGALLLLGPLAPTAAEEPEPVRLSLGQAGRLTDLVLPGPELQAKPRERDGPLVLRVVTARPHGSAFRYDLEFYGLEPGAYDLGDHLERRDGAPADDLPPLPVLVSDPLLPWEIEPRPLEPGHLPRLGGYRALLVGGGAVWAGGLAAFLVAARRRRRAAAAVAEVARGPTLAERLRPLVEDAVAGRLDPAGHARLERLLLGVWRRRLDLGDLAPAEALARLREHEEAGALLRQLEVWLHAPPGRAGEVDVAALLEPYRGEEAPE